jgi:hypothetical protein
MRLKKNDEEIPKTVPGAGASFQLGDTDAFWVTDNRQTPPRQFQVNASLKNITDISPTTHTGGLTMG